MDILFFITITGIAALLTRLLLRHLKNFDVPNERSSHTQLTPRGGGIAIMLAFLLALIFSAQLPVDTRSFSGYLLAAFLIAAISLYDDFKRLSFKIKLAGFLLAMLLAIGSGNVIAPGLGWWLLTLLWMMGLTNACNFMDGLDGLVASTAVIAALFLAGIAFIQGSHSVYWMALSLAAATAGFLFYNWSPAKIFMGDVGSTFIGFTFAVLAVANYNEAQISYLVLPLLFFHFIYDTAFTFFRRLLKGENVFTAHRSHLYQLLNRSGFSHQRVTLIYAAMALAQGVIALWMVNHPAVAPLLVGLPLLLFYVFYAVWVLHRANHLLK